jgi:hypothetical protein
VREYENQSSDNDCTEVVQDNALKRDTADSTVGKTRGIVIAAEEFGCLPCPQPIAAPFDHRVHQFLYRSRTKIT